jgi:transcription antitermination factor NusA-like protein
VIRILDHQHGRQRKVILVVRVEQQGALGQRQKQLGFLVSDIENHLAGRRVDA